LVLAAALSTALRPIPYLAVVPCLGAVSDVLGARSRVLDVAYAALLLFGGVAWTARLFGGGDVAAVAVTSFFSLALLVPTAVVLVTWVVALRSAPRDAAFWLAAAAVFLLFGVAITSVPLAMADAGAVLDGGGFAAAHHELLLGMLGFAVAAAVHRSWPLATAPSARGTAVGCVVALVGVHVTAKASLLAGLRGMPLTLDYPAHLRVYGAVGALGWVITAAGACVIAATLLVAVRESIRARQ